MVLHYGLEIFNFTCPTNGKSIHIWEKAEKSLLLYERELPLLMTSPGYSCDIISGGNPQNNKIKY